MARAEKSAPQFAFIDGLRGMAILGVIAVHTAQGVTGAGDILSGASVLGQFLNAGARGVQLFFVVSAFTLFSSSRVRFAQEKRPVLGFYVRRFFRIMPLWWLAIGAYTAYYGFQTARAIPSILMYFGFIRFASGAEVFPIGWSIFVEETFYLLFPWVYERLRGIYEALAFLIVALVAAVAWNAGAKRLGLPNRNDFIFLFPLNHWFCFAAGIVLFFLKENAFFKTSVVENRRLGLILDGLTALALFKVLRAEYMTATLSLVLLFVACMSPHTRFGKFSRNELLGWFGRCCYSIYLFHPIILSCLYPYQGRLMAFLGLGSAAYIFRFTLWYAVISFASLMLGLLAYRVLERPFIDLGKKAVGLLRA